MKLRVDSEAVGSAGRVVRIKVSETTADINRKVLSRAYRSVQAMRDAELRVLKGQRICAGRAACQAYRKPAHALERSGKSKENGTGRHNSHCRIGKPRAICIAFGKRNIQNGSKAICRKDQRRGCAGNPKDL